MDDHEGKMEQTRSECFDLAATAYSGNHLDLEGYEALAAEIAAATSLPELVGIRARLPKVRQPPPEQAQVLQALSSSIKKAGRWVESSQIHLAAKSSKVRLDFTSYARERRMRVDLALVCSSADIRIIIPENFEVIERIASNRASVVRDRHRSSNADNSIVLSGDITGSRVRVKRKKG